MDILIDKHGDIKVNSSADITLAESLRQKIKIRLLWFFSEWRFLPENGMPYFDYIFCKNPNIEALKQKVKDIIFEVEGVKDVKNVNVEINTNTRQAKISFGVITCQETYNDEVVLYAK